MPSWLVEVRTLEPGLKIEARIEAKNRAAAIRKLMRRKVFAAGRDEPVSVAVAPYEPSLQRVPRSRPALQISKKG